MRELGMPPVKLCRKDMAHERSPVNDTQQTLALSCLHEIAVLEVAPFGGTPTKHSTSPVCQDAVFVLASSARL